MDIVKKTLKIIINNLRANLKSRFPKGCKNASILYDKYEKTITKFGLNRAFMLLAVLAFALMIFPQITSSTLSRYVLPDKTIEVPIKVSTFISHSARYESDELLNGYTESRIIIFNNKTGQSACSTEFMSDDVIYKINLAESDKDNFTLSFPYDDEMPTLKTDGATIYDSEYILAENIRNNRCRSERFTIRVSAKDGYNPSSEGEEIHIIITIVSPFNLVHSPIPIVVKGTSSVPAPIKIAPSNQSANRKTETKNESSPQSSSPPLNQVPSSPPSSPADLDSLETKPPSETEPQVPESPSNPDNLGIPEE